MFVLIIILFMNQLTKIIVFENIVHIVNFNVVAK